MMQLASAKLHFFFDERSRQFLHYIAPDGAVKVDVLFSEKTAWLTQKAFIELLGVKVPAVNKNLKNIFEAGELAESSVVSILETTVLDGKNYRTRFFNLDAIIAVGYRVIGYQFSFTYSANYRHTKPETTRRTVNARELTQ